MELVAVGASRRLLHSNTDLYYYLIDCSLWVDEATVCSVYYGRNGFNGSTGN